MDDHVRGGRDEIADLISEAPPVRPAQRARWRAPLLLAGVCVLLAAGVTFYLQGGRTETTDDAFLQAGQAEVAADISGPVVAVDVVENQAVRVGQALFHIDPRPFQTAVDEAAARLADARAAVGARRASYLQARAEMQAGQARLAYAVAEAARQKGLLAKGISSQNQYDQAALAVQTGRQAIQTSTQQAESVRAMLSGDVDTPTERQPAVQAAQAVLDRTRLDLAYTVVRAAQDGIVTRVNQLQPGNYVAAARPVFTLVGTHIWVEANFKESQLRYMRIGQPATVTVDAFSDQPLAAHVTSFSPGTGNSFALLPAENASGNWVKVVQRLAVELDLDQPAADLPLHAGLSARVAVDTFHIRHLFTPDTDLAAAPAR